MEQINFRNVEVNEQNIFDIFSKANIKITKINDMNIFRKSFTHTSYVRENNYSMFGVLKFLSDFVDFKSVSNERIEFLGDSILNSIICEYLFDRYPNENEGFLTKLKTKIVSKKYLCNFAKYLDLGKYILISNHMENINGRELDRILEDAFESFVAATNKNFGREVTRQFIINVMEENINFSKMIFNDENYKDRLIKYCQKNAKQIVFEDSSIGQPNKRTFLVTIYINGIKMKSGYDVTKKDAEHNASRKTLIDLEEINDEELCSK